MNPRIIITEQPQKSFRFRYNTEGPSAGQIRGRSSTKENATYPTIQFLDCNEKVEIVVSCVTKDFPYAKHPHKIVGKGDGFADGTFTKIIDVGTMICTFNRMGIQCTSVKHKKKKKKTEKILKPKNGDNSIPTINLSVVRLKFQCRLIDQFGLYSRQLASVFSEPIINNQSYCKLEIISVSHTIGSCEGGEQIILLCEKVDKHDVDVRFYEVIDGQVVWEENAIFKPADIHKQYAIDFKTPKYNRISNLAWDVPCLIQLTRPSDGLTSSPVQFCFKPTVNLNVDFESIFDLPQSNALTTEIASQLF